MRIKSTDLWQKMLACMLVVLLTAGNLMLIGDKLVAYAKEDLEAQEETTQSENVEFGAYFKSEGKNSHSLISSSEENPKLYIHLKVKNSGYLKDSKIELNNANYIIEAEEENLKLVAAKNSKELVLNQINYGTEETVELPIKLDFGKEFLVSDISKTSRITLRGTYIGNDGQETKIEKSVELNLTWKGKTEVKGTSSIITNKEKEGKTILQQKITLENVKATLPINKTELEIEVPEIYGLKLEEVKAFSSKTLMTNGKEGNSVELKQNYNEGTGILKLETENKQSQNGTVYLGIGKDEFIITYKYDGILVDETNVITKTSYTVKNYGEESAETKTIANTTNLKENYGNYLDSTVTISEINKAKIYANISSNKKELETEYIVTELINVVNKELADEIVIEPEEEAFVNGENQEFSTKFGNLYYTYYKELKVNKADFDRLLGQDGSIIVYDENGNILDIIDSVKQSQNGVYSSKLNSKPGKITIKTTKPVKDGLLKIESIKSIRADLAYSKEQVDSFKAVVERVNVNNANIEGRNNLDDAVNHLKVETNKNIIDSKEEEIEIKVELGNNNEDSILYNEPTVLVSLPSFVEKVEVLNSNLLFEDELKINSVESGTIGENKAIRVELDGTQTKFNSISNTNGTTLILGAKLTNKQESGQGELVVSIDRNSTSTAMISVLEPETVVEDVKLGDDIEAVNDTEYLSMSMHSSYQDERVKPNTTVKYIVLIYPDLLEQSESSIKERIKNLIVKDVLPEGVTYQNATIEILNLKEEQENIVNTVQYDSTTNTVTWNVGDLQESNSVRLTVDVKVNSLPENVFEKNIQNSATAFYDYEKTWDGIELVLLEDKEDLSQTTNLIPITAAVSDLSITKLSQNINEINNVEDSVKFIVNIKNMGKNASDATTITMNLPNEIIPSTVKHGKSGMETEMSYSSRSVVIDIPEIQSDENYVFELTGIIDMSADYHEKYQIVNVVAMLNGNSIKWQVNIANPDYLEETPEEPTPTPTPEEPTPTPTPEEPTPTPTPEEPTPTPTPEEPTPTPTPEEPTPTPTPTQSGEVTPTPTPTSTPSGQGYTVSGTAWLDKNKDGIMQATEEFLKDINVKLIQNNQTIQNAKTDNNGNYLFKNVTKGEYQISFEFDGEKYNVTEYKKTGEIQINSSAIKVTGKTGEAVTDILQVKENSSYINIGLIKITEFDMSLKKTVNKIIVQTEEGTKTYNPGSNLAKVDISAKYINGATVLVEYKLTIKNEGEIPGTVRSVIDYMPREMQFSTDLNKTWVLGADGNLYNSELKNIQIEPGETKELLLVLTKKMTDYNVGLINNTAELEVVENSQNVPDKDSTPANKRNGEDDMSSADVLIGIRTGKEVAYITLMMVVLVMILTGAYIINRKVLKGIK